MRGRRDSSPASLRLDAAAAYGHIPNAINLDSEKFYDPATNRLRKPDELDALAASVPATGPVVNYCNTGHWSATDWFVLSEILGRKNVKLYYGSMVEWSAAPNRPISSSRTKWDDIKKFFGQGLMTQVAQEPLETMTAITSTEPAVSSSSRDWLFVAAGVISTALLIGLVWIDQQPLSAVLLLLGFGLGVAFLKFEFSFTASWRRFLVKGEAGPLLTILLLIAIVSVAVVPIATLWPRYGGSIAPIGISLILGSFVFGIGMQLANGCGSGTLYTVGGGSGRMLFTLATFIIGSVLGSLTLPSFLKLGGIDPVLAGNHFGPWGGLIATLVSIGIVAFIVLMIARRRNASTKLNVAFLIGALVIAALMIGTFLAAGHPWSVTFGYTVWGAKLSEFLGFDLSRIRILAMAGTKTRAVRFRSWRHRKPDKFRHDLRRHGRRGLLEAVCTRALAACEIAALCRSRRLTDGLGRKARFRLQHRRICRRRCVRLAARLDLVCVRARGLRHRNSHAAVVRPVERLKRCGSCMRSCFWSGSAPSSPTT